MENQNKEKVEILDEATNTEDVVEEQTLEVVEEQQEEVKEEPYVGKEVTTSIRYDYRTMKYFNMYNAVTRRKLPLWYLIMGIGALIFAVYTVVDGYIQASKNPELDPMSSFIFGGIFVLFAAYLLYQSFRFESYVDKTITNHFMNHKVAKQHINIREDKITLIPLNKPEESFSYDWAQVTRIEEIEEFFFLYIGRSPLIIDKNPENMVEGTIDQMKEIFNEKIELKPYKKYNGKVVKKPITYIHQDDLENDEESIEVEEVQEETQE